MMKKLLVLALVMGVASLASAGLTYSVNGSPAELMVGESYTLTIAVDSATWGGIDAGYIMNVAGATATNAAYGDAPYMVSGPIEVLGNQISFPAGATILYTGAAAGNSLMTVDFTVAAGATSVAFSSEGTPKMAGQHVDFSMAVVPEPATLALLGLGAMVLRRKK